MPAHPAANTEPNHVLVMNGTASANSNAPAENNDTNRLEVGSEVEDENSSTSTVPDGGWGWMVVLGAFMVYFLGHGFLFTFGVFVENFVDYFEGSKSAIGGVGSLMIGLGAGAGNV